MTTFNPDLLPANADPEGSTRYENVDIYHEQIECRRERTEFYDDIANANRFIIADYSPQYNGYECRYFKGTVLKETNGYSWWKNIYQGE